MCRLAHDKGAIRIGEATAPFFLFFFHGPYIDCFLSFFKNQSYMLYTHFFFFNVYTPNLTFLYRICCVSMPFHAFYRSWHIANASDSFLFFFFFKHHLSPLQKRRGEKSPLFFPNFFPCLSRTALKSEKRWRQQKRTRSRRTRLCFAVLFAVVFCMMWWLLHKNDTLAISFEVPLWFTWEETTSGEQSVSRLDSLEPTAWYMCIVLCACSHLACAVLESTMYISQWCVWARQNPAFFLSLCTRFF